MEYKTLESTFINPPHKIEGKTGKAMESFYELAKGRVRHFNHQQFMDWLSESLGEEKSKAFEKIPAIVFVKNEVREEDQRIEKYLTNLEIAIDTSKFNLNGKDYTDILSFVVEHEIYESWLRSKKGFLEEKEFSEESRTRAHSLALRRQFLLAEKAGKGEKMFEWFMLVAPKKEKEYMSAWENAKNKLHK